MLISVYVDEVPLPFSVLARGATLDLERVEVLKGPQGTLFGQNAPGGAINYIAAKPTDELSASARATIERFGRFSLEEHVSGPLSSGLNARLAIKADQGGAWQKNSTRPDKLGDAEFYAARFILDAEPSDTVRLSLNVNGWKDKGDETAAQLLQVIPFNPDVVPFIPQALFDYPVSPTNNRAADWTPATNPRKDHEFIQGSLRADIDISDSLTLTSITAYSDYSHFQSIDPDGVSLRNYAYKTRASIKAFSQEIRLAGELSDQLSFIIGGAYNNEKVHQRDDQGPYDQSGPAYQLTVFNGVQPFFTYYQESDQKFKTAAVFGNIDFALSDQITLHAGARYTDAKIDFAGCTYDDGTLPGIGLSQGINAVLNLVRGSVGLDPIVIDRGSCITIDGPSLTPVPLVKKNLDEDNLSWRTGLDFKANDDILLYANVSHGYKSVSFPLLSATDVNQFNPVTQELVTAYEVGMKATLFDRLAQLNVATFYYDYKDKQLKGRVVANPNVFGPLEALINVPESSITGGEVHLQAAPVDGLRINFGATYIDSKIRGDFLNITSFGESGNFGGEPFAYTPKWQFVADGEYRLPVSDNLEFMVGSNLTHQSGTNAAFSQLPILNIAPYTLVDFRAGIFDIDDRWSLMGFVRNAFDDYYWTNSTKVLDTTVRFAGRPRTFDMTASVSY